MTMSKKTGYARYTFAFASDVQKLADEKHIKVASFSTKEYRKRRGSYDLLRVMFVVPRPDKDEKPTETPEEPDKLETIITELEDELEKSEVNNHEI